MLPPPLPPYEEYNTLISFSLNQAMPSGGSGSGSVIVLTVICIKFAPINCMQISLDYRGNVVANITRCTRAMYDHLRSSVRPLCASQGLGAAECFAWAYLFMFKSSEKCATRLEHHRNGDRGGREKGGGGRGVVQPPKRNDLPLTMLMLGPLRPSHSLCYTCNTTTAGFGFRVSSWLLCEWWCDSVGRHIALGGLGIRRDTLN